MSKFTSYWCDICEGESDFPMVYQLRQVINDPDADVDDDDPELVVRRFDFCSTRCLTTFATDMSFDFPDVESADNE